jgi:hypothetical protein
MMNDLIKGTAPIAVKHLHRVVSAHKHVMEGIASHAEKERVKREMLGQKAKLGATLPGSVGTSRQSLHADRAVLRDESVWLLGCDTVCRTGLPHALD